MCVKILTMLGIMLQHNTNTNLADHTKKTHVCTIDVYVYYPVHALVRPFTYNTVYFIIVPCKVLT